MGIRYSTPSKSQIRAVNITDMYSCSPGFQKLRGTKQLEWKLKRQLDENFTVRP